MPLKHPGLQPSWVLHTARVHLCFPNQPFLFSSVTTETCSLQHLPSAPFSTSHSAEYFISYLTEKIESIESSLCFHSPNLHTCVYLPPSFPVPLLHQKNVSLLKCKTHPLPMLCIPFTPTFSGSSLCLMLIGFFLLFFFTGSSTTAISLKLG